MQKILLSITLENNFFSLFIANKISFSSTNSKRPLNPNESSLSVFKNNDQKLNHICNLLVDFNKSPSSIKKQRTSSTSSNYPSPMKFPYLMLIQPTLSERMFSKLNKIWITSKITLSTFMKSLTNSKILFLFKMNKLYLLRATVHS
ncbi:hypothetical protein H8356DRAFT_1629400 [Neocallimastix lanati (nom. inval.)]|nr:hypothetical protein H8356DRAFT_1629400 [Neocallimastix sp. JGI-2020a]